MADNMDIELVNKANKLAAEKGRMSGAVLRKVKYRADPGYLAIKEAVSEIRRAIQAYVILQKHADETGFGIKYADNARLVLEDLVSK